MINAIEWIRVSTKEQAGDDRAGLQRQRETNALTAMRHNLRIIQTFELYDVSGTSVSNTPEMMKVIEHLRSGHVRAIVVADFDRLCRLDDFRSMAFLQDIKEACAIIYTSDNAIDLNTQSGFLNGGLLSLMGGNDLVNIKKRMVAAKEIKRKDGKHPGNEKNLPQGIGYDRKTEHFFYIDDKVRPVKKAFELFHDDGIQNLRELGRLVGIQHRTLANLLRNEIYAGYRTYLSKRGDEKKERPDGTQGDRKKVKRSPDEIIRVRVFENPLISEKMFSNVQELLNMKNKEYHKKRPSAGERFLYAGFLRCGVCGRRIYTTSGGTNHKKDYYCCSSKKVNIGQGAQPGRCSSLYIPKELLEDTVTSFVGEQLTDLSYLSCIMKEALSDDQIEVASREKEDILKNIQKLQKAKNRYLLLYGENNYTKEELDEVVSEVHAKMTALKIQLKKVDATVNIINRRNIEETLPLFIETLSQFRYWSASEKREFLRSQIPEFLITKDGVQGATLSFCKLGNRMDRGSWPRRA